jgi:hypothetical protein
MLPLSPCPTTTTTNVNNNNNNNNNNALPCVIYPIPTLREHPAIVDEHHPASSTLYPASTPVIHGHYFQN